MPINAYQLGSKQLFIRLLCLSVSANTFTDIYRVGIFNQVISLLSKGPAKKQAEKQ